MNLSVLFLLSIFDISNQSVVEENILESKLELDHQPLHSSPLDIQDDKILFIPKPLFYSLLSGSVVILMLILIYFFNHKFHKKNLDEEENEVSHLIQDQSTHFSPQTSPNHFQVTTPLHYKRDSNSLNHDQFTRIQYQYKENIKAVGQTSSPSVTESLLYTSQSQLVDNISPVNLVSTNLKPSNIQNYTRYKPKYKPTIHESHLSDQQIPTPSPSLQHSSPSSPLYSNPVSIKSISITTNSIKNIPEFATPTISNNSSNSQVINIHHPTQPPPSLTTTPNPQPPPSPTYNPQPPPYTIITPNPRPHLSPTPNQQPPPSPTPTPFNPQPPPSPTPTPFTVKHRLHMVKRHHHRDGSVTTSDEIVKEYDGTNIIPTSGILKDY